MNHNFYKIYFDQKFFIISYIIHELIKLISKKKNNIIFKKNYLYFSILYGKKNAININFIFKHNLNKNFNMIKKINDCLFNHIYIQKMKPFIQN